jgi:CheY-like chemotaxis protein/two-component sensor histidine kinase
MSENHEKLNKAFAAKEQMLAIVSHDIKNPLSAIQLEAQMLLRAAERSEKSLLSAEVKIQANRILKTTDRLKNLISDLLDKNKSENNLSNITKVRVDCIKLIYDVLDATRPLMSEKEISLKLSLPKSVFISIDRNKMFQVFTNLLSNAVKFTPEKGMIHLSMEENDYEYIFSVDDSGPGLSKEESLRVFEKYWCSNSKQGTGLGLFICKTIIDAHNGHIFIERCSELKGARFRFTIPKIMEYGSVPYFTGRNDQRKKIYIIDDDEDLREVISWALSKEGHAVYSFESPQMALDNLSKNFNMPDLIVVDYRMDEMKGSEFLIQKNKIPDASQCPVLMISASPKEVESEVSKELYKEVITKPIDLEGLVNTISKCFAN